jgi:hypothetical protein
MKKFVAFGFALLMIMAVFVPFASAINDPTKVGYQTAVNPNPQGDGGFIDNQGQLAVNLLCRSPQIGGEFSIAPVTVTAQFTNGARVDAQFVEKYVKYMGAVETKQFQPSGTFDTRLPFGTYVLALKDGNGGQPEYALVTIKANQAVQTVSFQGHGITPATITDPEPVITVTAATYGATQTIVDQQAYDETIVDVAAFDETVIDTPAVPAVPGTPAIPAVTHVVHHAAQTHIVHHAAVTHQVTVIDTPAQPATQDTYQIVTGNTFTGYAKEQSNNVDFTIGTHKYHIVGNYVPGAVKYLKTPGHAAIPAVTHQETVVDQPAYDETIVDVAAFDETVIDSPAVPAVPEVPAIPAVTHVVHHAAQTHIVHHAAVTHTEGAVIDVKAQVQAVLDLGIQNMKFDNAQNPGGIFSTADNVLRAQINDPAYGQVKNVHIEFTVDGVAKTVNAAEYEAITLA